MTSSSDHSERHTMELTDEEVFARATRAYERARVKLGAVVSGVVALIPLVSLGLGGNVASTALLGTALTLGVGVLVWRGGVLSLSAMAGLKAGLVPLAFAHAANLYGHVCIPGRGCSTLCIPACTVGGVLAGVILERTAQKAAHASWVRLAGAAVAFLAGALGCACVGFGGIAGLAAGMVASVVTSRAVFFRGTKESGRQ
jgi:hypothetical protein